MKKGIQLVSLGAALFILGSCSNDSATEESSVSVSSALEIESEESSSLVESSKTEALPESIQSETAEKQKLKQSPRKNHRQTIFFLLFQVKKLNMLIFG